MDTIRRHWKFAICAPVAFAFIVITDVRAATLNINSNSPLPVRNLLHNPSIEEGTDSNPAHWRWGTAVPENFKVAWSTEARTGHRSLYIKAFSGVMSGYWTQVVRVEPKVHYTFCGWFRLKSGKILVYVHGRVGNRRLDERFYAQSARSLFLVPIFLKPEYVRGMHPERWYPFRIDFTTFEGMKFIAASVGMYFTAGEVWFDDLELRRATVTLKIAVNAPEGIKRVIVLMRDRDKALFDSGDLAGAREFKRVISNAPSDAHYTLRVITVDGKVHERMYPTGNS